MKNYFFEQNPRPRHNGIPLPQFPSKLLINDVFNHLYFISFLSNVALIDSKSRIIYISKNIDLLLTNNPKLFTVYPKFKLSNRHYAEKFNTFLSENQQTNDHLSLLVNNEKQNCKILLDCKKISPSSKIDPDQTSVLIKFRYSNYESIKWQFFKTSFFLTNAELRLCRALMKGLTLKEYCSEWNVKMSTARSQLHLVLNKTSTHRQSDLLHLIYLFREE